MKIGKFDFGNNKTFIIAELSANHNGSIDNALQQFRLQKKLVLMQSNYKLTPQIL